MSPWEGILTGIEVILNVKILLYCFAGVLVGTLVGVLPGIGMVGACSILLPLTFGMDVTTGLILLCAIYYGSMYGGSTTAILVNIPGEVVSVVTCIDGHQMALKGRAGPALVVSAIGSFVAGTMGIFLLMIMAPTLARTAVKFGPPELVAIATLGLLTLSRMTGRSPSKSYAMMLLGVVLATVGVDSITGMPRFSYGSSRLLEGFEFVAVIMGLYGLNEVLRCIDQLHTQPQTISFTNRDLIPTWKDMKESVGAMIRGGLIGFILGIFPGATVVLSTFVSYWVERKLSKHPEEFGKGAIAGVAGPEAANNGAMVGHLVPLLSLGVPFAAMPAILLAAFLIHGVIPGPLLVKNHPTIFWGLIVSMYVGNVMLLILNLPLVGLFARIASIPIRILMPVVIVLCFVGTFAIRNNVWDLVVMVIFGVFGYFLEKAGYEPSPLVLGLALGPMLEDAIRQSMIMFGGDYFQFFTRPISGVIIGVTILVVLSPLFKFLFSHISKKRPHPPDI